MYLCVSFLQVALTQLKQLMPAQVDGSMDPDNFRMKYRYGRYGATYDMVALSMNFRVIEQNFRCCQRNPPEAKLQATSTRDESTEPTNGVMKHTYKAVLYNYCLMQYCCILS